MFSLVIIAFAVTVCNANPFQRIVGGKDADISNYPWQLSLQFGNSHTCGAVLYNSNIALTAAHCVTRSASSYTIRGGHNNWEDGVMAKIQMIIKHPDYNGSASGFPNDIAILYLDRDLQGNNIAAIDIPATENANHVNGNCVITGWGLTDKHPSIPDRLQFAPTTVINHHDCKRYWGQVNDNMHLCVFSGGLNGACNGDSGGPLVCLVDNDWELAGLTSWGRTGCSTHYPSVYTRVSKYREWIQDNAGPQRK